VSAVLRTHHTEVLAHTGQHYDDALSGVFFRELALPQPDLHMGIGSGSHGVQTAAMLVALEASILAEKPDWVLVYGDTNSTLAGALAAAKLGVRLAHVEAGLRSFNRMMPEEHNRIIADHVSDLLLCPTQTAMLHLSREGLAGRSRLVGDVMIDILHRSLPKADAAPWLESQLTAPSSHSTNALLPKQFALLTIHRGANTDDSQRLRSILSAIGSLEMPVVFPAHPRVRKALAQSEQQLPLNVLLCGPAPYFAMLALERDARWIFTDSGGVQKEAHALGTPCVTLRAETEWPETLEGGWNVLVDADGPSIIAAAERPMPTSATSAPFGNGHAADEVVRALEEFPEGLKT